MTDHRCALDSHVRIHCEMHLAGFYAYYNTHTALHQLFLTRSTTGVRLRLDQKNEFTLTLSPCPARPRWPALYHCPTAPYDPMPALGARLVTTPAPFPLLVHAAGVGKPLLRSLPLNDTATRTPVYVLTPEDPWSNNSRARKKKPAYQLRVASAEELLSNPRWTYSESESDTEAPSPAVQRKDRMYRQYVAKGLI